LRNVPGLDLPGIDFVKPAQGIACDAVRLGKSAEVVVGSAVPMLYGQKH
jgi:benzoylformate decarboxylase